MNKELRNKKIRVIVWGLVWLVSAILSITGIYAYNTGRGYLGGINDKMKRLSDTYNNLSLTSEYREKEISINAKAKKDKIIISYSALLYKGDYEFTYNKNENNIEFLSNDYNEVDSTAELITRLMIEAISVYNGNKEGDATKLLTTEDMTKFELINGYKTNVINGIKYNNININKSIVDDGEVYEFQYITVDDLINDSEEIINENYFLAKKGISIYKSGKATHTLLFRDENGLSDNTYKSIESFLKVLYGDTAVEYFNANYDAIKNNKKFEGFYIEVNPTLTELEKQAVNGENNVVKLTVEKIKIVTE